MLGLARKIFGSSNERRVKGYGARTAAIARFEPALQALSDDGLRAKTAERAVINEQLNQGQVLAPADGRVLRSATLETQEAALTGESAPVAKDAGLPGIVATDVADALAQIARGADRARPPVVLIAGSLYLAGEVLSANGYLPG